MKDMRQLIEWKLRAGRQLMGSQKKNSPARRRFGCIRSIVFFSMASMQRSVWRD
jgi:hypothetical protein